MDRGGACGSRAAARTGLIRVCFHGAESTGKTVIAKAVATELDCPWVPEFGRDWAEAHGTSFTMADLLAIARGQDAAMQVASRAAPPVLILDTDPLMTAAWAAMLFGEAPEALLGYEKAELYLLFASDVPWVEDGTRLFGNAGERARFARAAEDMLVRAEVRFERICGTWAQRRAAVHAAIAAF